MRSSSPRQVCSRSDSNYESVRTSEYSEASDAEDESLLVFDNDAQRLDLRQLQLGESVYDDALLSPLVGKHQHQRKAFLRAYLLLYLNFALQGMVLLRVSSMVVDQLDEIEETVFGEETGLCNYVRTDEIPAFNIWGEDHAAVRHEQGTKYLQCLPDEVFFAQSFRNLDLDGDGFWTIDEAWTFESRRGNSSQAQMHSTFTRILSTIEASANVVNGMSVYQHNAQARSQAEWVLRELRSAGGKMPRAVYQTQVLPFMDMCFLMDSSLCGNMLFRRAFNRTVFLELFEVGDFSGAPLPFLELNPHSGGEVHDMSRLCKLSVERICPLFFTVAYELFGRRRRELCGKPVTSQQVLPTREMKSYWDTLTQQVLVEEFDGYSAFEQQTANIYRVFLLLILTLWFMAIVEEFRKLLYWWRVMLCKADDVVVYAAENDEEEQDVVFSEVSCAYKFFVIVSNLLPRTLIAYGILYMGARFLVLSKSYEELMMNSLALTFLVSVDEMTFAAFVSNRRRTWIANAKPLQVKRSPCVDRVHAFLLWEYVLVPSVLVSVCVYMWYEYHRKWGKEDLERAFRCICQVSGTRCAAAQVLGGYPSIKAVPEYSG